VFSNGGPEQRKYVNDVKVKLRRCPPSSETAAGPAFVGFSRRLPAEPFSEDDERRPLMTEEELHDASLHAAATVIVAYVLGCEFLDCRLNDDGYKWPTSSSRIKLMSAGDWWPEESFAAHAAIHEAGSMAVAKRHGRGHHLIRLVGEEYFGTPKLLDDPKVWKAIEALAQFIRDNYEGEGCYGALGTAGLGGDSPALKLIKSMDLPTLTYA
jgi:hypothetical protein